MMVSGGSDALPVPEADLSPQQCATAEAEPSDPPGPETGPDEAMPPAALPRWLTGPPAARAKRGGPTVPPR